MNKLITTNTWQSVNLKLSLSHSCYPAHTADRRGETKLQRVAKSCELTESHGTFPLFPMSKACVLSLCHIGCYWNLSKVCDWQTSVNFLYQIFDFRIQCYLAGVVCWSSDSESLSPPCHSNLSLDSHTCEGASSSSNTSGLSEHSSGLCRGLSTCWDSTVSCAVWLHDTSSVLSYGKIPGIMAEC